MSNSNIISRTKTIRGADWKNIGAILETPAHTVDAGLDTGIDIIEEIVSALKEEATIEAEQSFIEQIIQKAQVLDTFDCSKVGVNATFVGELHNHLSELILKYARPFDNTVIVSPVALTILQSSTNRGFIRSEYIGNSKINIVKFVGMVGNLKIMVNPYANMKELVLIGFISENEEERDAALLYDFVFGIKKTAGEGWNAIGINADTLTFI
jgi:hypothetical protein